MAHKGKAVQRTQTEGLCNKERQRHGGGCLESGNGGDRHRRASPSSQAGKILAAKTGRAVDATPARYPVKTSRGFRQTPCVGGTGGNGALAYFAKRQSRSFVPLQPQYCFKVAR